MKRRDVLGALGAGAAGLAALSTGEARAQGQAQHQKLDKVHEDCLKACADCARSCDETFNHCYTLVAEGKREHARSMRLLSDCAAFCGLSACMIARHSPLMASSCEACEEACKVTATEVEKFSSDEMKVAVKALRECERTCREMVRSMGHDHRRA